MSASLFGLQAVSVNGSQYFGVRGQVLDRGNEFMSDGYDGTVHETHHALVQRKAVAEFQSVALKQLLAALGTSGTTDFPLVALDGASGVLMSFARVAVNLPGYDATSVHVTKQGLSGVLVMESVRWSLGQPAEMSLRGFFTSAAGITDPITSSATAALPTQSANQQAFTLSAITLNGTSVTSIASAEITVDHKFAYDFLAGNPYPTFVSGAGAKGRASIRLQAELMDVGAGEGTGAVSVVFTNLAQGGTLGSTTVTFTFNGSWTTEDTIGASHTAAGNKRLTVRPIWNGTTKPLTWAIVN